MVSDNMYFLLLCLACALSQTAREVKDGETIESNSKSELFKFHLGEISDSLDLSISLTKDRPRYNPDIYVKLNAVPTEEDYTWKGLNRGPDYIAIANSELEADSDYYILVTCNIECHFYLTVSHTAEIAISEGISLDSSLLRGYQAVYIFETPEDADEISVHLTRVSGISTMNAGLNELPRGDNNLPVNLHWGTGSDFQYSSPASTDKFYIIVGAVTDCSYSIIATGGYTSVTQMRFSTPHSGYVESGKMRYYSISVDDLTTDLEIELNAFSGTPYMYVKAGAQPTTSDYDWLESEQGVLRIDSEQLAITEYFIGVYGFEDSRYTLLVTQEESPFILLIPEIPQTGRAENANWKYYFFNIPTLEERNITLHLTQESGNPDLYAKLCNYHHITECAITDAQIEDAENYEIKYSAHSEGNELLKYVHFRTQCFEDIRCAYIVGVRGNSEESSRYTLQMITENTMEFTLREGRPFTFSLAASEYTYLKYSVSNETVTSLLFTLNSLTGDSDLYVSKQEKPSKEEFDKKSTEIIGEVDYLKFTKGVDSESLVDLYHIAVYAKISTSFSLVVQEKKPGKKSLIQLYPGYPQMDTLYSDFRVFSFPVLYTEETKQDILISLTPVTGSYELYAANKATAMNWETGSLDYNWKYEFNSSSTDLSILIKASDPNYLLESQYLVMVKPYEFSANHAATYSIAYKFEGSIVSLMEDVPYTGSITAGSYAYYTFPIHYKHEDLQISLIAGSGDPDMYLSFDPDNRKPTQENFDIASNQLGSEFITIGWENGLEDKCPDLPEEYSHGDEIQCTVYIGVTAGCCASFTLKVHPFKDTPQALALNTPSIGFMENTDYNYFYSLFSSNSTVKFTLQTSLGEADLFINIYDIQKTGSDDRKRPSRYEFQFYADEAALIDSITFKPENLTNCESCVGMLSVYCYTIYCEYSISASQNDIEIVLENEPKLGNTKSQEFNYYKYFASLPEQDILVKLTTISGGDPDLYMIKRWENNETFPTRDEYDWKSLKWGNDSIHVRLDDDVFKLHGERDMRGTYIIGVYSDNECSFSLTVNNHPTPITRLSQGIPQTNYLGRDKIAYYYYYNILNTDLSIALTPSYGSPELVVSHAIIWSGQDTSDVYDHLPTTTENEWASSKSRSKTILNIETTDENFCWMCDYIIGVYCDSPSCNYNIVVNNQLNATMLLEGQIVKNFIDIKDDSTGFVSQFYTYDVLSDVTFNIAVSPYSGWPIITVSNENNDQFKWDTLTQYVQHVRVSKDDIHFTQGTYNVQVNCYSSCSYSVVAHQEDSYINLIDGWPVSYSLKKNDRVFFRASEITTSALSCLIRPEPKKFHPTFYVDLGISDLPFPGPNSPYEFSNYNNTYNRLYFSIPNEGHAFKIGAVNNGEEEGSFEMICSSGILTKVLTLGETSFDGILDGGTATKFELNLDKEGYLEVLLVPCVSNLKLEVSKHWNIISEHDVQVSVTRLSDGMLRGVIPNAEDTTYYITVSLAEDQPAHHSAHQFEITAELYDFSEIPQKRLVAGNQGLIYSEINAEDINLEWSVVEFDDNSNYEGEVEYQIYITSKDSANFLTSCSVYSLEINHEAKLVKTVKDESTVSFKSSFKEKTTLNVLAVIQNYDNKQTLVLPYNPVIIKATSSQRNTFPIYAFLAVAIVMIVGIAVAILFFIKYRKSQRLLQIEMSDVRNVAHSDAYHQGQVKKNRPYDPLNEEDSS